MALPRLKQSLPLARIFTERGHRDLRVLNFCSPVDFGTMNWILPIEKTSIVGGTPYELGHFVNAKKLCMRSDLCRFSWRTVTAGQCPTRLVAVVSVSV